MEKRCPKCGLTKPVEGFHRNAARKDRLQSSCKSCQRLHVRRHYRANREYYLEKAKAQKRRDRAVIRAFVERVKGVPCADCGSSHPFFVMDFDHVRGKKLFAIGNSTGSRSLAEVRREIAKCDIVCANCHRVRTYNRRLAKRREKLRARSSAG